MTLRFWLLAWDTVERLGDEMKPINIETRFVSKQCGKHAAVISNDYNKLFMRWVQAVGWLPRDADDALWSLEIARNFRCPGNFNFQLNQWFIQNWASTLVHACWSFFHLQRARRCWCCVRRLATESEIHIIYVYLCVANNYQLKKH